MQICWGSGVIRFFTKDQKQIVFFLIHCCFVFFVLTQGISFAVINDFDRAVEHPPIPLFDEEGRHVLETNNPYSSRKSCAGSGCHDYEAITHAYHFEMGRDEADDAYGSKRGLPHLVSPGYYGGYTCMGGNNQQVLAKKNNVGETDFADYGSAGWIKTCLDCHAGGGWAEKDREGIRYDEKKIAEIKAFDGDYYERQFDPQTGKTKLAQWDWKKSGVAEADCLFCHVKFSKLKLPSDSGLNKALSPRKARGALIEKGFFRQAATGLMEYMKNTEGKHLLTIARTEGDFTLNEKGMPIINWHADAFTENGRVTLSMLRFPESDNCMACHSTSNYRRGFYGFGKAAKGTLETGGGDEVAGGGTLEDDYRDDIHKGTSYRADNDEKRSIENCNACHSSQYYKPATASIDLDANHNFPKGNSDMDVRNDLDYTPNVRSCENCHIYALNAVIGAEDSLLKTHREGWKKSGDLAGYAEESLTQITQTHFDTVSCQTCHITDKTDAEGHLLQMMYRFKVAEDGQAKIVPYNPRLRYYWQDRTSGHILVQNERNAIFVKTKNASGGSDGVIVDPISGLRLGQVSGRECEEALYRECAGGFVYSDPDSYENFIAVKKAYDSLLRKKSFANPDVTMVWSESNEYVISHNTRATEEALSCVRCHVRESNGVISQLISPTGLLGAGNSKVVTRIPDARLVSEGVISIGLAYSKLQPSGAITQNVADILFETRIDPFMSLLKNSSATEIAGEFTKIATDDLLIAAGSELAALLKPDFSSASSFIFSINKGSAHLRSMVAVINGGTANNILFPTYRAALGTVTGAEGAAQNILKARHYGTLRSNVFYLDVLDQEKKQVTSFNGDEMYIKAAYQGVQESLQGVRIVVADRALNTIRELPSENLVMIVPSTAQEVGYIVFKMREMGYFIIADK